MRLGGIASNLVEISSRAELKEATAWAAENKLPIIVIGGGSNIFWRDEGFNGLVIVNKILGYEMTGIDEFGAYLVVGAGEIWDSVVARSVEAGLTGIEALSLIPGTTGATPVQNVGAYGQEISQSLTSVEAYDLTTGQLTNLPTEACQFSYRDSAFKHEYRGRYIITGITLHLMKGGPQPPFYGSVQSYLDEHNIQIATARSIREAVIAIRSAKLPNVAEVANNGSFFANPIITTEQLRGLKENFPEIVYWPLPEGGAKIPAAWLIEQVGFKDHHDAETGMATWPRQPLVFVNEGAKSTANLLKFRQKILDAIKAKFGLTLTQEPELLP